MAKKKMSIHYIPARISRGVSWFIIYYQQDPNTKKLIRHRESHNLNRIKCLIKREKKANEIEAYINSLLPFGYPHTSEQAIELQKVSIKEGLKIAADIKNQSDRKKTRETYKTQSRIFLKWCTEKGLDIMPVDAFDKSMALSYLDDIKQFRKVGNRTRNNYMIYMRSLFSVLHERNYTTKNPFKGIKKLKAMEKSRKSFHPVDAGQISHYLYENDKDLLLAVLLIYHCFIRPAELRRMKINMIDLSTGLINLPGEITKNKKSEYVTIPDVILPYINEMKLHRYDHRSLLFGTRLKPHLEKKCGDNTMNNRHRKALKTLYAAGKIKSIVGLSIYSWKDTGVMSLIKQGVDLEQIRKQLRHATLQETQHYVQSLGNVNIDIKRQGKSLFNLN